jgi:hypothetical protein
MPCSLCGLNDGVTAQIVLLPVPDVNLDSLQSADDCPVAVREGFVVLDRELYDFLDTFSAQPVENFPVILVVLPGILADGSLQRFIAVVR